MAPYLYPAFDGSAHFADGHFSTSRPCLKLLGNQQEPPREGQPPGLLLDPAKGLGLASSKDTRESNAAEPMAGEADGLTTPREDAIPASTVLDGASPAKIVAKRPGLCAKAVARKRARAGKKAAKQGADRDTSPDDNEDDVDASYDGNHDDGSEDEQVNAPARRAARALFDDDETKTDGR